MSRYDETQKFFQFMETEDKLTDEEFVKQATYWHRKYKEYAEDNYQLMIRSLSNYQLMIRSLSYSEYEIAHRDYRLYKDRVEEIEEAAKTRGLILL